jgi:DNA modification methylase
MDTKLAPKIVMRETADLIPYARNARTHDGDQVSQIAASIREFGFTNPILLDGDSGVIAGHGRLAAASKLKIKMVPCIELAHLTAAQKRAYILADNKLAENAGWDKELLSIELGELAEMGMDLELLGFSDEELGDYLSANNETEGLTDENEVPDVVANPVPQTGETWLLGKHRLRCGDSTNPFDVEEVLNGVEPHLMVTDPPYGVEYDPNWRNEAARSSEGMGNRALGAGAVGKVKNDDIADWTEAWRLFPGDVCYVWHADKFSPLVAESLKSAGFEVRNQIIWKKGRFVIGRGHYHWQHEPCWYAVRKNKTGHWQGARDQSTVWDIDHNKSETGHGTQKPVQAMLRPIENNSSPGQAIYEPFCGSGTTIIACEKSGRVCHAIEIDPVYVDVIIRRWQDFTGQEATLEENGLTFASLEKTRRKARTKTGKPKTASAAKKATS